MKILAIALSVIMIGLWITGGVGTWLINRDTVHILERAQVAANAADMQNYVTQLEQNMEERGMTTGYAALVWKSPENDMGLIYRVVQQVNERLSGIKDLPPDDTTYQVALDDLRGTLRELNLFAGSWYWVCNAWWIIISFVLLGAVIGIGVKAMYES